MPNPWLAFTPEVREGIAECHHAWVKLTCHTGRPLDDNVMAVGEMIRALDGKAGELVAIVERSVADYREKHGGMTPQYFSYCVAAMRRHMEERAKSRGPKQVGHDAPPDFHAEDLGPEPDGQAAKAAIAATLARLAGKEG